ncbi:hypothetical protein ACW9HR_17525 [Nocardia gipuzkoensis]
MTQVLRETLAATPAAHGFDKVAERGVFPEQFAEFGTDSVGHPIILGEKLGDSEAIVLSVFRSRFGVPRCHGEGYGKIFGQHMRSRCGIHVSSDKRGPAFETSGVLSCSHRVPFGVASRADRSFTHPSGNE